MELIEEVLVAIRTTSEDEGLKREAETLIQAARQDLKSSGITEKKLAEDDALIRQCIIFYAKAYVGYDNPDGRFFSKSYEDLKRALCSKGEYTNEV